MTLSFPMPDRYKEMENLISVYWEHLQLLRTTIW